MFFTVGRVLVRFSNQLAAGGDLPKVSQEIRVKQFQFSKICFLSLGKSNIKFFPGYWFRSHHWVYQHDNFVLFLKMVLFLKIFWQKIPPRTKGSIWVGSCTREYETGNHHYTVVESSLGRWLMETLSAMIRAGRCRDISGCVKSPGHSGDLGDPGDGGRTKGILAQMIDQVKGAQGILIMVHPSHRPRP